MKPRNSTERVERVTSLEPAHHRSTNPLAVRQPQNLSRQCAWLFAIAMFGYPIMGNIISVMQIDSRALSIPFRIAVGLFSAWIILISGRLRLGGWRKLMILIWFLYVLRLLYDLLFPDLEGASYALQFFIAASVLPAIALMKARAFHQRRFALVSFLVASAGALSSLLATVFGGADIQEGALQSGRLSLSALDPASLGYLATNAILCGFILWRGAGVRTKLCLGILFFPLFWCLILTGSKGPALALVLCMGIWGFRTRQLWKLLLLSIPVLVFVVASEGSPLAARLSGSADDESTLDRIVLLNDSFTQIEGSPIIGSAFVELKSGFYPHNVFVEAALAMGIPGALLFMALMTFGAWKAWRSLGTDEALLGLLFFAGLFAATISGALFGAITLWIPIAMLSGSPRAQRGARGRTSRMEIAAALPGRVPINSGEA